MARRLPFLILRSNAPSSAPLVRARPFRPHRFVAAVVCALLTCAALPASPRTATEPEVKAAAISNIIGFVEWPATAFPAADSPFVVGIIGQGPIAAVLEDSIQGGHWHGRKVVLERYTRPEQALRCHVLWIAHSEQPRWAGLRTALANRPILTISDAPDFARRGGVVQLAIAQNKLRFTINHSVAHAAGLEISSKVLRLAEVLDSSAP